MVTIVSWSMSRFTLLTLKGKLNATNRIRQVVFSENNYITWKCNMKTIRVKEQIETNGKVLEFSLVQNYINSIKGLNYFANL